MDLDKRLNEFINANSREALEALDEQMREYVDPAEIEEHGSVYEAYCETCNGEAESDVVLFYARKFVDANPDTDLYNVQEVLSDHLFEY